jgi:NAD(P)H-dependent flavin oxidoreductase YrpB (nitropropane dioxygenase family)
VVGGFDSQFEVCLEEKVPVLSLFWCDAAPYVQRCHDAGILLILQVGSAEEACAGAAAGVDVIVAQGCEAGGHVRGEVGLMALLPTVVQAVPDTPVLAAGGLASGRGLAAALSLGAAGVWIGTRFVATYESEAHPDYRRRLLDARATDAVRCDISQAEWPSGAPYRVLRSVVTEAGTPPIAPVATIRRGDQAIAVPPTSSAAPTVWTEGQTELMPNYAGQGVEIIRDILPAATIVEQMVTEAEDTIRSLATLLA